MTIQIAIKDVDKTPMWSLPGTRLFLSFETPGPINVDISTLSPDQQKILAQELSRGVLVGKGIEHLFNSVAGMGSSDPVYKGGKGMLAKSYSKIKLVRDEDEGHIVAMENKPLEFIPDQFDPMEERRQILGSFLSKHVATVKKELPGKSLSELRILRDMELNDKKRESVIKMLDALISKAQTEVFNSIQKSYNSNVKTAPDQKDLPSKYLENVTSVVESEQQDVTIKLGASDDE